MSKRCAPTSTSTPAANRVRAPYRRVSERALTRFAMAGGRSALQSLARAAFAHHACQPRRLNFSANQDSAKTGVRVYFPKQGSEWTFCKCTLTPVALFIDAVRNGL